MTIMRKFYLHYNMSEVFFFIFSTSRYNYLLVEILWCFTFRKNEINCASQLRKKNKQTKINLLRPCGRKAIETKLHNKPNWHHQSMCMVHSGFKGHDYPMSLELDQVRIAVDQPAICFKGMTHFKVVLNQDARFTLFSVSLSQWHTGTQEGYIIAIFIYFLLVAR